MPEHLPQLHIIEPTEYYRTLAERLQGKQFFHGYCYVQFLVDTDKYAIDIGFKRRHVEPKKSNLSDEELERQARRNERRFSGYLFE